MSTYNARFADREEIAEGTMAFHFEKPEGFSFRAGQAIDLILPGPSDDAQSSRHAFSIASAPDENRLTIATRMRDSPFKRTLGSLPAGTSVEIDGPFGALTLHNKRTRPAVFIAGGIGITPFVSILRQAGKDGLAQSFILIYSNRRPEDAAFLAELQALETRMASFQAITTMTRSSQSKQAWPGNSGPIDAGLLKRVAESLAAPIYYLAGPTTFVEAMRNLLNEAGIDEDDVRSESFYGY